jgi:hypothetical protein
MFTGHLSPIAVGETYEETLELKSDDDGELVSAAFLAACTIKAELFAPGETTATLTATTDIPSDGIIICLFNDTSSLCPGLHRVRVRLTKDGITDDVLDASLPVLP